MAHYGVLKVCFARRQYDRILTLPSGMRAGSKVANAGVLVYKGSLS